MCEVIHRASPITEITRKECQERRKNSRDLVHYCVLWVFVRLNVCVCAYECIYVTVHCYHTVRYFRCLCIFLRAEMYSSRSLVIRHIFFP